MASMAALALAAIAAGVVAVWLVARAWRLDPAWVLSVAVVVFMFSGNWGLLPVVSSLPIPPDRLLLLFALAMVAMRVHAGQLPPIRWMPTHALLALTFVYGAVSLVWTSADDRSYAFFSLTDAYGLLPFVVFLVAPSVYHSTRQRSILLAVLIVVGAYLSLTACMEMLGLRQFLVPRYIGDPNVGLQYGRARGPFVQAVANGLALYGCAVASTVAAATWRGKPRAVAIVVVVLCLVGCFLTLTRAIWLGTMIASVAALLTFPAGRRLLVPTVVGATVALVLVLAAVPGLAANASSRQHEERPIWDRYNSNRAAVVMVADRPLTGFGWGAFRTASLTYARQSDTYPLTGLGIPVHNVFLSNAVELGVPGALIWIAAWASGLVGTIFRRPELPGSRLWRAALVALLVQWFVTANATPVAYPLPILLLWMWAGATRAMTADAATPRVASRRDPVISAQAG